ncbi:armadillo-type protein [Piptocephalis cylindrospora]|uniref:Armadillo-type protein n=1 Tax=Piptocephalis cylindrospora TaxID=1907219 RepID=A0A4P9Y7I7_9FUNG|nr:armadillo-type protein [Piptocephalis cylindrospora]|eukprot:RKP15107.1 armadillo-type protein [Piptocephalis cylindrospora]
MENIVLQKLQDTSSSEGNTRVAAELALRELAGNPEFPLALLSIVTSGESLPVASRQAAALGLHNYVDAHWDSCPEQARAQVRARILPCLADPSSSIRSAVAYATSKIAVHDWPEAWPDLLPSLIHVVTHEPLESPGLHGALSVLSEIIQAEVSEEQFTYLAPSLTPELLRILTASGANAEADGLSVRTLAMEIFGSLVEGAQVLAESATDAVEAFTSRYRLDPWITAILQILGAPLGVETEAEVSITQSTLSLSATALRTLNLLLVSFRKAISSALSPLLTTIWTRLSALLPLYLRLTIQGPSSGLSTTLQDPLTTFLYASFDFSMAASRRKAGKGFFINSSSRLTHLLSIIMGYMRITADQEVEWSEDANAFVADEEEDSYSASVRNSATDLLLQLVERYPTPVLKALGTTASQELASTRESASTNQDPQWWRTDEAVLHAIGRSSDWLVQILQEGPSASKGDPEGGESILDLAGLFEHVILGHVQRTNLPFLQGRALLLAAEYGTVLPPALAHQYLTGAMEALTSADTTIPVRVSALRTIHQFGRSDLQSKGVRLVEGQDRERLLSGVLALVAVTREDSLNLVLEALLSTLRLGESLAASWIQRIGSEVVLPLWRDHSDDFLVRSLMEDVVLAVAKQPNGRSLCDILCPPIAEALGHHQGKERREETEEEEKATVRVGAGTELLVALTKSIPSPLPDGYVYPVLSSILGVMERTKDRDILQGGQQCVRLLVAKGMDQIIQMGDQGLQGVMSVIRRGGTSESDVFFVGDLASQLVVQDHPAVKALIPEILSRMLVLLTAGETSMFIQSIVLVFARIIERQPVHELVDFLLSQSVGPDGKNGLSILMEAWMENYTYFQGYFSMKLNAHALATLYLANDPRVMQMTVKGDPVVSEESSKGRRITTRSQSKINPTQYVQITIEAKAMHLLLADWAGDVEATYGKRAVAQASGSGEEVEEEEWDDVEEEEDDEDVSGLSGDLKYLSDFIGGSGFLDGEDGDDEDEETDPTILQDPIYQADLQVFLKEFFQQASQQTERIQQVSSQLNQEDIAFLTKALSA